MAVLLSKTSGYFTSSSTWAKVDQASYLDSESYYVVLGTSPVSTATWSYTDTPPEIDAIAVKLRNLTAVQGVTLTVELQNATLSQTVASVTVYLSQLPPAPGWVVLKLSSPVQLATGYNYRLRAWCSAGSLVELYRDPTYNNFSRMLRTTTTASPQELDQIHVLGALTGSGNEPVTVTMDDTGTNCYGPIVSGGPPQGMTVGCHGSVVWDEPQSGDRILRLRGKLAVYATGKLQIGSEQSPYPAACRASISFQQASNNDSGLLVYGQLLLYGRRRTGWVTRLKQNASAGQNYIYVDSHDGWQVGDTILVTSTHQYEHQVDWAQTAALSSEGKVELSSSLSYAHTLLAEDIRPFVVNAWCNLTIVGQSTSLRIDCYASGKAVVVLSGVSISYCNRIRFDGLLAGASVRIADVFYTYGSTWPNATNLLEFSSTSAEAEAEVKDFFSYNYFGNPISVATSSQCQMAIRRVYAHYYLGPVEVNGRLDALEDIELWRGSLDSTIGGGVLSLVISDWNLVPQTITGVRGIRCRRGPAIALSTTEPGKLVLEAVTVEEPGQWYGISFDFGSNPDALVVLRNSLIIAHSGGSTGVLYVDGSPASYGATLRVESSILGSRAGGTASPLVDGSGYPLVELIDCNAGIGHPLVTSVTRLGNLGDAAGNRGWNKVYALRTSFSFSNYPIALDGAQYVGYDPDCALLVSVDHGGQPGDCRAYTHFGVRRTDSSIYLCGPISERLELPPTPRGPLQSTIRELPARAGETSWIQVFVRISPDYSGSPPELVLLPAHEQGLPDEQVLARFAGVPGQWHELSGYTPAATRDGIWRVVVRANFTSGYVNVDNWFEERAVFGYYCFGGKPLAPRQQRYRPRLLFVE